ncbi:hypothetical protein [Acetobacterium malicum]|uniref:hypothetical protein n=1 Tax=Acetobacterium malicum TaxID=52692 RepID=UPI0003FC3FDC|nr:hypothetical protein [Acetobacterium dehalogenans]
MNIRIKEISKNNKGSSLAFVLIIGVIIMIMVLSLMAVANSDFIFTQKTVESRQAYMDAKSVIEFGKIFINNDMSELNSYQLEKIDKLNQKNALDPANPADQSLIVSLQSRISELENLISEKENEYPKKIFGTKNSVTENADLESFVVKTNSDTSVETVKVMLGKCDLTASGEGASRVYTFNIDVQGLRRELNYKVDIPIQADSGIGGGSGPPIEDPGAKNTNIHTTGNKVKINIQGEGNEKEDSGGLLSVERFDLSLDIGRDKDNNSKFQWENGKTLDLKAKNIYVTAPMPTTGVWQAEFNLGDRNKTETIWFKQNYVQNNGSGKTNTFKAKTIIFDKNLTINDNTNLNIECDTLWVKGDILINALGGTNSTLNISANNIIVGDYTDNVKGDIKIGDRSKINWTCSGNIWVRGNIDFLTNSADPVNKLIAKNISIGRTTKPSAVTVKNATRIIWDCENFWLHGDMTTITSGSYQEFKNIVYFYSGKINLSNNCQISITGRQNSKNQVFVEGIIPLESIAYNVKIKNFELFQSNGDFGLKQNSILELDAQNVVIKGNLTVNRTGTLNINTQYLDVAGKTYADNSSMNISGNGTLKARFNGYEQYNSTVNMTGAEKIILGSPVILKYDNPPTLTLNVKSDSIYLSNSGGDIKKKTQLKYSGKTDGTGTDFYFYPDQLIFKDWETDRTIKPGKYQAVTGNKLEDLPLEPLTYNNSPEWLPLAVTLLNPTEPSVSIAWSSDDPDDPVDPDDPSGKNKQGTEKYY